MHDDKIRISERILILLHPVYRRLAGRFPSKFQRVDPPPPHPSSMIIEKNWVYRNILPRFFRRITIDEDAIERLKDIASDSTIVYVAKHIGHLEYSYYNHLFESEGLPLAVYNNAITMRRWKKARDWWDTLVAQETEIGKYGKPIDLIENDMLADVVSSGYSVMIKVPPSTLKDEELFIMGPLRPLVAIIDAQRQNDRPIKIVPLDFLWSKRPQKHKRTLIDILFGEKENPGLIRKTALFWRNYKRHAQAAIGKPIDLKEFVEAHPESKDADLAHMLREKLVETLRTERRTITGPPIRPRSWFVHEVLSDNDLDKRICAIAAERNKETDHLRELAARYIKEIAANVDYTYLELCDRILGVTLCKMYENFDVDTKGLSKAKEMYGQGPVVFVPNHKSHVDYLILSHILYKNGMTVPHIAAGINLSFWPLGKIFRSCGAYFIRRHFKGNDLYKAVLETYLKVLLKEGYSQEFFIEGGRSRTGKLRRPKLGMISMLRSAAESGGLSGVCFIPVTLTYDRVAEQKSLVAESEGGKKEGEKASQLLKLTKYLKRKGSKHGSIYIRFGDPVHIEKTMKDPVQIEKTAQDICYQINKNVVVTPKAIAAMALLSFTRQGVALQEFGKATNLIYEYLSNKGAQMSKAFSPSVPNAINNALARLAKSRLISIHTSAVGPYISIEEGKRIPLSFFKNSIIHYMITIGTVSRIILSHFHRGEKLDRENLLYEFEGVRTLLGHEFHFATTKSLHDHIDAAIRFLRSEGALYGTNGASLTPQGEGFWILEQFSSHLESYLETLYIAITHADKMANEDIEQKELIQGMQRTGNDLLMLGRISHREAINRFDLENTLKTLCTFGVIDSVDTPKGKTRGNFFRKPEAAKPDKNLKVELEKLL